MTLREFLEFNINGIIPIDGTIWRVVSDLEQLAFDKIYYPDYSDIFNEE